MRTIAGHPIPDPIIQELATRFGPEWCLEHLVLWLLERESSRVRAESLGRFQDSMVALEMGVGSRGSKGTKPCSS